MGWRLVKLSVEVCKPIHCKICGKLVAKDHPFLGIRLSESEYRYMVLDGVEVPVCDDCFTS